MSLHPESTVGLHSGCTVGLHPESTVGLHSEHCPWAAGPGYAPLGPLWLGIPPLLSRPPAFPSFPPRPSHQRLQPWSPGIKPGGRALPTLLCPASLPEELATCWNLAHPPPACPVHRWGKDWGSGWELMSQASQPADLAKVRPFSGELLLSSDSLPPVIPDNPGRTHSPRYPGSTT